MIMNFVGIVFFTVQALNGGLAEMSFNHEFNNLEACQIWVQRNIDWIENGKRSGYITSYQVMKADCSNIRSM